MCTPSFHRRHLLVLSLHNPQLRLCVLTENPSRFPLHTFHSPPRTLPFSSLCYLLYSHILIVRSCARPATSCACTCSQGSGVNSGEWGNGAGVGGILKS